MTMDNYELGLAVIRAGGTKLAHLADPRDVEHVGRWVRPAIAEMAEAAAATARIIEALNSDHSDLVDAVKRLAEDDNRPFHKPAGNAFAGNCSLCEVDVDDLFGHHMLHFKQWDVELVVAFMAGLRPNDCHSRRLLHPLWTVSA